MALRYISSVWVIREIVFLRDVSKYTSLQNFVRKAEQ